VTLGGLSLFRALALIFTNGNPIFGIPLEFRTVINSTIFGVPAPIVIVIAIAAILWTVMNKTPLGEYILAVGGNEEAARVAGVPVKEPKLRFCDFRRAGFIGFADFDWSFGGCRTDNGEFMGAGCHCRSSDWRGFPNGREGKCDRYPDWRCYFGVHYVMALHFLIFRHFINCLLLGLIIIIAMLIDRATRGK
jgi:ribose transport system permease protein